MARSGAVWAIDIGQCALKALRCRAHTEPGQIVAEAFDYIEYPKILSQPGADPTELVADALKQFLSRNSVRGDRVAISVSGQSGLARFIKLPPVEAKKIPDIVRYEARQQIPFDLNDVIWDYQRMGGGSVEEGFALETEIGLFAMKREAVFRALAPLEKAGIEVDFIQLAPLALYNFVLFDQLTDLPSPDEYDPEDPPASVVVLSLGTDATDLVVTNGFRVWQRSVPLGGNHFTKALTKELKVTFAKAEHLKRNAATAQDSKAIFQAMRPVFRDLLTELQRSIGYFTSIDRAAKIGRIVALGNATKLPGLRKYLSQSLGFEVIRLEQFRALSGSQVLSAPAFKSNAVSFGVCYGLALQGLGLSGLRTNLLPGEILKTRLVRQKKPWAVAAAATVLLACGISVFAYSHALSSVAPKATSNGVSWEDAEQQAASADSQSKALTAKYQEVLGEFIAIDQIGRNLTGDVEGRLQWLELLRAVNACLPPYPDEDPSAQAAAEPDPSQDTPEEPEDLGKALAQREELHVTALQCQYFPELADWYAKVQQMQPVSYKPPKEESPPQPAGSEQSAVGASVKTTTIIADSNVAVAVSTERTLLVATPESEAEGVEAAVEGPAGPGWVIRLTGYHLHNFDDTSKVQSSQYVVETLLKHLSTGEVTLPTADRQREEEVSTQELGISYPVLVNAGKVVWYTVASPGGGAADASSPWGSAGGTSGSSVRVRRFDFDVQFCWTPKTPSQRQKEREANQSQAAEQVAQQ